MRRMRLVVSSSWRIVMLAIYLMIALMSMIALMATEALLCLYRRSEIPYELSSRSEGSAVRRQMQIPRSARDDSHKAPARSFAPLDSRGRLSLRKTFQHGCHF